MPLRLDVKRKLLARSDRVKCVDLHPTETWALAALYNGHCHIWNYETQQLVKSIEVCELPVRAAKFVARKSWVVTGSDDMHVRVFNYNTLERIHQFEAHSDYLRSIAIHPTQPFVLTSSDDMLIKLWDWDNKWQMKQCFEGHTHYVMQIAINPKDNMTFATASLDRTVKVWQFGSTAPNFTLEGHDKGVNCVDYYAGGDKPYLISGADDHTVRIWDYQNKTCVQKLEGHTQNVSSVAFHPELPIIITGSEDSTVRIWNGNTYRLENTLNYGLERVWSIYAQRGTNVVAIGYDEGSVIAKMGREEPAVSMDSSGKILLARHMDIQQANLKTVDAAELENAADGERISLGVKDLGACEIYPQSLAHSSNGRFVVACGDGEYIVYTAMALRNKDFGQALEFVWGSDPNTFAIRESATNIKIKKNFKDHKAIRSDAVVEGIEGGPLLAARSSSTLAFYDWESGLLVRRIEIVAKHVYWSDNGELVAIAGEESFYILKYNADAVANANESTTTEDGVEDAFDVIGEQAEAIKTAFWIGDCLIFTTSHNRLSYYVGGEIVTIAHLERPLYLLGYQAKESRIYAVDKDLNIVSYKLLQSVLEYQTAVMRRDFETADKLLAGVPKEQRTRVAHFLEKQGFKKQALAVSIDPDHRFDLAVALGDLETARKIAETAESEEKWKLLSQAASSRGELKLAGECLARARDFGGLLLLASSAGSHSLMEQVAAEATNAKEYNVGFVSHLLLGHIDACLESLIGSDRIPEAAFFARTYAPSQVPRILELWKAKFAAAKKTDTLADPEKYPNLFPGFTPSLRAESFLREIVKLKVPATAKPPSNARRNFLEELEQAEAQGAVTFSDDGRAQLRGVSASQLREPARPLQVNGQAAQAPPPNVSPQPKAAPPKPRTPEPPAAPPRQPTPPFHDAEEDPEEYNSEPDSEDDAPPARAPATSGGAGARPDVLAGGARPDVLPATTTAPDLVAGRPAPAAQPQPSPQANDDEVRWSDDEFGDDDEGGNGGNDINLDDLNLDEEEDA